MHYWCIECKHDPIVCIPWPDPFTRRPFPIHVREARPIGADNRLTDQLETEVKKQAPGARWTVGMTVERMV